MRNKATFIALAVLAHVGCLAQESQSFTEDFKNALRNGARIKFVVKIVDDHEKAVTNATIVTAFHRANDPSIPFRGLSDSNGLCVVEGVTTRSMLGTVLKNGYYTSKFQFKSGEPNIQDYGGLSRKIYYDSKVKDGRWLPWNPIIHVTLKKTHEPVHMIHSRKDIKIPQFDEPLGFDFEKGDWIVPKGRGVVADMVVIFEKEAEGTPFRRIVIEFPGTMNGAYLAKKDDYSVLKSTYRASSEKVYQREIENTNGERGPVHVLLGGSDYMVFRVRSVIDEHGNLIAAHYGKIYGPLDYFVMARDKLRLVYYFNPAANDTNLEFDGKGWGEDWGR